MVSLSNGSMLKLKNVMHVPKLKRNLISVGQLADIGMKTTFDDDVCKIVVVAQDKKEGTFYITLGSAASISVVSLELDVRVWHRRLGRMSEKGMKNMLSKDKVSGLNL